MDITGRLGSVLGAKARGAMVRESGRVDALLLAREDNPLVGRPAGLIQPVPFERKRLARVWPFLLLDLLFDGGQRAFEPSRRRVLVGGSQINSTLLG